MASMSDSSSRADEDVALDLKGILAAIGRRIVFVVLAALVIGGGTFFVMSSVSPRYEAETKILIENREPSISRDQTGASDRVTIDAETVVSQVQLLTSRDLARRVAEKNQLADKAEFDGREGGLLETVLASVGLGRDRMRVSPEERVVDAFIERLKVFQVDGSRVITVQFRSTDADLAATIANSVAEEYLALQSEAKRRTSEDQTRWLGEEIEKLRVKVRDADEAVEKYRARTTFSPAPAAPPSPASRSPTSPIRSPPPAPIRRRRTPRLRSSPTSLPAAATSTRPQTCWTARATRRSAPA